MLDIVASYHCMQFPEKLMNQASKKEKEPSADPNSGCQNCFSKISLSQSLDIMVTYHVQNQKKLMIQSSENLVTYESDFIGPEDTLSICLHTRSTCVLV